MFRKHFPNNLIKQSNIKIIYVNNDSILFTLINMVNHFSSSQSICIPEINLLNRFSPYEFIPFTVKFCPKQIIEQMVKKHQQATLTILKKYNLSQTIVYKYSLNNREEECTFSNNMHIYSDIITICCLYHIRFIRGYEYSRSVMDIMRMMYKKYKLYDSSEEIYSPNILTLCRIAQSFPSVMMDIYFNAAYDNLTNSLFANLVFSQSSIPRTLLSHMIALIIPKLDNSGIPFALLLTIIIKLDEAHKHNNPNSRDISLEIIYHYIFHLHHSMAFPAVLKLELCMKWGIVIIDQGEYKYSSCFSQCRQRAKDIISHIRPQDPSLENILSKL